MMNETFIYFNILTSMGDSTVVRISIDRTSFDTDVKEIYTEVSKTIVQMKVLEGYSIVYILANEMGYKMTKLHTDLYTVKDTKVFKP